MKLLLANIEEGLIDVIVAYKIDRLSRSLMGFSRLVEVFDRKKGMWIGGTVPLGYDVTDRRLVINKTETQIVRSVFNRFAETGSATVLARELRADGLTTKQGRPISKGYLYRLLNNRVYIGETVHKGQSYPGQHKGIIPLNLWDKVHAILRESPRSRASNTCAQAPAC